MNTANEAHGLESDPHMPNVTVLDAMFGFLMSEEHYTDEARRLGSGMLIDLIAEALRDPNAISTEERARREAVLSRIGLSPDAGTKFLELSAHDAVGGRACVRPQVL